MGQFVGSTEGRSHSLRRLSQECRFLSVITADPRQIRPVRAMVNSQGWKPRWRQERSGRPTGALESPWSVAYRATGYLVFRIPRAVAAILRCPYRPSGQDFRLLGHPLRVAASPTLRQKPKGLSPRAVPVILDRPSQPVSSVDSKSTGAEPATVVFRSRPSPITLGVGALECGSLACYTLGNHL